MSVFLKLAIQFVSYCRCGRQLHGGITSSHLKVREKDEFKWNPVGNKTITVLDLFSPSRMLKSYFFTPCSSLLPQHNSMQLVGPNFCREWLFYFSVVMSDPHASRDMHSEDTHHSTVVTCSSRKIANYNSLQIKYFWLAEIWLTLCS